MEVITRAATAFDPPELLSTLGLVINLAPVGYETLNIMLSLCTRFWRVDTCRQPLTENASLSRP
jgi:hypothetical protein